MHYVSRIASFLLAVLILVTPAAAFEGLLLTLEGEPLANARLQVLGGRGVAVVDATGRFVLEPDPTPPFQLLVTRPDGVLLQPVHVEALPAEGPLEIRVAAAAYGSLTVLGATPDLELPPAGALTVSGRGDLNQRGPLQLTEVLENIPGASVNGSGHTAIPALRGLAQARTLILLDEGRVTAERRAGPSATFLDPASIEEVEVVRGPGSVAYGSDALGGLIRMRTRVPSPGEPFALRYALVGGSNDSQRSVDTEVANDLLGGGFMVGASYRDFDNYSSPEGEVAMSGMESMSLRTGYQRGLGPGLVRFLWRTDLGRDIGKPATDSATRPTSYPEEDSHRASLAYEQPGPGNWSRLSVSLSWDEYRLLTQADTLATPSRPRSLAESDVFAHDYGARVEAERPLGAFRLLLGLDLSGRYGLHAVNRTTPFDAANQPESTVFEESVDRARKDDLGLFAGLSTGLGPVALSAGIRGDWVETSSDGGYFGDRSTSQSDVSGFIGASVPLGHGVELSAQVARGFRDALLSDRYYRGISGRGFVTGNPDLEPETSLQGDLALRYASGGLSVALYGYDYRVNDLIERYREGDDYFFRNRGEAEVRGVELEGGWTLAPGHLAQFALQWQEGEALDDGTPLDGIPPRGVMLTVRREPGQRWWWLARVAAYDRVDEPGPDEKVIPGYAVVDAGIGYELSRALAIQLHGRNLLDQTYLSSADEKAVLEPGRAVQLSLRGRL